MNFLRRAWRRLVVILTTPITLGLLLGWWRRKPKAAEHVVLDEPKPASVEPECFISLLDTKKYAPGPRFVIERRRRAMKAGKIPGASS